MEKVDTDKKLEEIKTWLKDKVPTIHMIMNRDNQDFSSEQTINRGYTLEWQRISDWIWDDVYMSYITFSENELESRHVLTN